MAMWRRVAAADVVIERKFKTEATHQGYIEPHACLANVGSDGQGDLGCTQGHYMVRNVCAQLLGMDVSKLRVTASEIGGGSAARPRSSWSRWPRAVAQIGQAGEDGDEPRGCLPRLRPDLSATVWVKIGATKAGRITAAECELKLQGGAFPARPSTWRPWRPSPATIWRM